MALLELNLDRPVVQLGAPGAEAETDVTDTGRSRYTYAILLVGGALGIVLAVRFLRS